MAAADIDLDGGIGERDYRPASAAQIRDRYELGMGSLTVDLRDTRLPDGPTNVTLDVGVGEGVVVVPENVCVASRADVGAGSVQIFDRESAGIDVELGGHPARDARRAGGRRARRRRHGPAAGAAHRSRRSLRRQRAEPRQHGLRDRARDAVTPPPPARRFDLPSLVAGLVLICFGTLLLLDRLDVLNLRFAAVGPMVCAAIGAILLAARSQPQSLIALKDLHTLR